MAIGYYTVIAIFLRASLDTWCLANSKMPGLMYVVISCHLREICTLAIMQRCEHSQDLNKAILPCSWQSYLFFENQKKYVPLVDTFQKVYWKVSKLKMRFFAWMDNSSKYISHFWGKKRREPSLPEEKAPDLTFAKLEQRGIFAKKSNIFLMGCAYFPIKV